jgi:outer membrane protein assembly factor BamA
VLRDGAVGRRRRARFASPLALLWLLALGGEAHAEREPQPGETGYAPDVVAGSEAEVEVEGGAPRRRVAARRPRARPAAAESRPAPTRPSRLRYTLEGVELRGNDRTADRVVLRYVTFKKGDVLDVSDPELELTRFRLLGTGFFSSVRLSLRRGSRRGAAVLVIEVIERNTLIVENVTMGIAADEDADGNSEPISPYLGLQAAETNLAGTGITLGAGVGVAADQYALEARFADPAFAGSHWMINASIHFIDALDFFGNKEVSFESPLLEQREVTDYAVVDYRRFGGTLGAGHDLSSATRVAMEYGLERVEAIVPTAASHVRGNTREPIDFDIQPGDTVLSMLRAALVYDTRDAPFLPTRGTLASVHGTLGLSPLGSSYNYQKLELGLTQWWHLPFDHVVNIEIELGAINGDAPFFEKFYVGDYTDLLPDRVLGLNPDRRQPPNILGTDIVEVRYGDFAARLESEYRIPIYESARGSIYGIDFFSGGGILGVATKRELTDPPSGYEGARRIPVDLTYNLGLRIETAVGGFSIAFSNLLGLLPARSGGRK